MSHVFTVFDRLDYRLQKLAEPWDVLWSHQYPFGTLKEDLRNLKPHQKVILHHNLQALYSSLSVLVVFE